MAKKPTVTTLQSGFNSTEVLNQNFEALRDAFDNTLSLDGSTPNAMEADLDLNGNNIIGASGLLINGTDYLADVEAAKAAALVAQAAAELAENNAETAEVNAEASETAAANSATASASSASAASVSATAAQAAQTAAELAETNAETAETNAETAETNAAASAVAALASETAAGTSETNAAASEAASSTSETNAAASAAAASTSETNAATSETNAANSATASASSATASAASATAASASETAAAASEAAAAASEAAASTSETNAAASETAAAASETAAASSASSASTSASNAASSASSASASADAALAALDNFDDRYLGQKASDPTLDNDGDALVAGALYFNTTDDVMKVYEGSAWVAAYASLSGALLVANNLSDVANAASSRTNLGLGTGDSPTFAGLTTTGDVSFGDNDKAIFGAGSDLQIYHDGTHSYVKDNGTGDLILQASDDLKIQTTSGTNMAVFTEGTYARLFYNGSAKFETTSTGIDVTGTVTADGLTVDGNILDNAGFKVKGYYSNDAGDGYNVNLGVTGSTGYLQSLNGLSLNALSLDADTLAVRTGSSYRNRLNIGSGGDISFYEDTGTTPKFFWDASAESLGIGTSSPFYTLSVRQPTLGTIAEFRTIDGNNPGLEIKTSSSGTTLAQVYSSGAGANLLFETNAAERMRIDSSGNLLVGTTVTPNTLVGASATQGVAVNGSTGYLVAAASGTATAYFNRQASDGDIVQFRKDGSTVGSIGVAFSRPYFASANCGISPHNTANYVAATNSTGTTIDNTVDLGASSYRWKDGHFSGTVNAANFNTTSDATLKTNVETLTGSLDAVKSLRGVSFDWIENGGSEVGFIAQEVEEVLPEVVSTNDQGIKSVKYGNMVAVLVEAIKEQQLRIEALEAKLEG